MTSPEERNLEAATREEIDLKLKASGWTVQDKKSLNFYESLGIAATPSKQTFGFFNQNLVMEYGHEQAVADGVNVNYDVFHIRTAISEQGGTIEAGLHVMTSGNLGTLNPIRTLEIAA